MLERSFTSATDTIIPVPDLMALRVTVPLIGAVDNIHYYILAMFRGGSVARPKSTASM